MADTFQLITGLPEDRPKVYNLAGKTTDEAMKMLRYLKRNAFFGTHTGLPKEIRNSKINESLISNIGDYSVIDVYATSGNSCQIGTVVNFFISDNNNPMGSTYVYPCTDKDKPMGYMISNATPDKMGVCLVHGVLEVPLAYPKGSEEIERGNYAEYDLENSCFKFANSGYPVFNVYQDVDGDWIAIILFGDIASDYEYDGPFAVSVAGITGSTMYVNVAEGDFVQENERIHFADEDLMTDIPLGSGQTLWLNTYLSGSAWEYSFEARTEPPTQVAGSALWYRIAENTGNDLVQLQYGDIFNDIQHITVDGVSGSTAHVRLSGYASNTFEDNLTLRGIGCSFTTLGQNDIAIVVEGTTGGGGAIQHLYSGLKEIEGTTTSTPAIGLTDSSEYVNIVGGTNVYVTLGSHGEIIVGSTYSYTPTYQALTYSVDDGTATVGITHSSSNVKFEGMGSVYLTQIRSSADITERESWGRRYNPATGQEDGELKDAGWRGIIPLKIFDDSVPDDMVMTEISTHDDMVIDGSTVTVLYPLIVPDTTDEELGIIARCTINELDYPDEILEKAYDWAEARVNQGKSPFYNGGVDDEPLRNIPSADSIIVYGVVPSLMSHIVDDNVAVLEIAGSTSYVVLEAGDNIQITGADNILTISATGGTGGGLIQNLVATYDDLSNSGILSLTGSTSAVKLIGGSNITIGEGANANELIINASGSTYTPTYQNLSASVSGTTASIGITDGTGFSLIPEGDAYVRSSSNGFILGSTHTPDYQNLTSASTANGFTVGLSNSTSSVTLTGGTNVTITSENTGEFIINASGGGSDIQSISIKPIGVNSIPALYLTGDTDYVEVVGGTGITTAIDNGKLLIESTITPGDKNYEIIEGTGIDISDETETVNNVAALTGNKIISVETGYTVSVSDNTASVTFAGSTNSVYFKAGTNVGLDSGGTNIITISATGGGSTQDLSASVSNGTASIGITGGTGFKIIQGENIEITGNTDGDIIIRGSTQSGGGGGGGVTAGLPDYTSSALQVQLDTPYTASSNVWIIGHAGVYQDMDASLVLQINSNINITLFEINHGVEFAITEYVPVCIPIPAGSTFELIGYGDYDLKIYNCISTPPEEYNVSQTAGTSNGSLFHGLSAEGNRNIHFDQSLDGQPVDFNGASVL